MKQKDRTCFTTSVSRLDAQVKEDCICTPNPRVHKRCTICYLDVLYAEKGHHRRYF